MWPGRCVSASNLRRETLLELWEGEAARRQPPSCGGRLGFTWTPQAARSPGQLQQRAVSGCPSKHRSAQRGAFALGLRDSSSGQGRVTEQKSSLLEAGGEDPGRAGHQVALAARPGSR